MATKTATKSQKTTQVMFAQADLNATLALVSRAVPSRPTHPVLGNVLIEFDEKTQRVTLTGFDLSFGIQSSFPAEVEATGAIALPSRLLSDIVSRLPSGAVSLELTEGYGAQLVANCGRYSIQGMDPDEFVALPEMKSADPLRLPPKALLEGIRGVLFAASTEETKQTLTGVHLDISAEALEFAATDGHRLAVVRVVLDQEDEDGEPVPPLEDFEATVPARTLRELERILTARNSDELVDLQFDRGQVDVRWGDHYLTSRTLEGQYPVYRQLIPRQFDHQLTVERKLLLASLERIAVLADQKSNHIVKFDIDSAEQRVSVSAEAQDVGSGRETLESVQVTGEALEIAFNVRYLMESLKNIDSTEVMLQMGTPVSPAVITPLGGTKITHLVMPVQVRY